MGSFFHLSMRAFLSAFFNAASREASSKSLLMASVMAAISASVKISSEKSLSAAVSKMAAMELTSKSTRLTATPMADCDVPDEVAKDILSAPETASISDLLSALMLTLSALIFTSSSTAVMALPPPVTRLSIPLKELVPEMPAP